MLTIAEFLSKRNEVTVFWDDKSIIEKAKKRFNLDLNRVKITDNIFSKKYSSKDKFLMSLKYDRIIYLSDGSIPLVFPKKLIVHFQMPFTSEKIPVSERRKIFLVKKVICNSEYTKSFIDKTFGIKSRVLYPPVNMLDSKNIKKENVILTVGRYQPYDDRTDFKKLSFMASAFNKFSTRAKNWKMKMIVSLKPEYEDEFKSNVEKYSTEKIEIIKNCNFNDIQHAYKSSKIYWHAAGFGEDIDKNPERAEHFGISTVEAMSAGCVPIVINMGGQREIVANNVNGYLWNNEKELLDYSEKIIKEERLFEKLSLEAKRISAKFSKENFSKELSSII